MVKCGMCQRQFKTAAALKQHRLASHQAVPAPRVQPAPARRARRNQSSPAMTKQLSTGTDCLGTYSLRPGSPVGTVVANLPLSLPSLGVSRLVTEASLWARWRPKKLVFRVVCSGASTTFGGVIAGWTPEETWQPSLTTSDGARIASFRPSVVLRLNETKSFAVPCESLTKWYLTDGERGLSIHGTVVLAVSASTGGYTGQLSVALYLDWMIEFEGPDVELRSFTQDVIKPDAGWSSLFTTSDSSFNSERLTLKMHSGGSMCPFSAARSDRVYIPASTEPKTVVYYYDESSVEKTVTAFAKVQDYVVPGLLCFASSKDASEYVRSGDITKALKYTKASRVATPAIPTFVSVKPSLSSREAIDALLEDQPDLYDMEEFVAVLARLGIDREDDRGSVSTAPSGSRDGADLVKGGGGGSVNGKNLGF
nr:MAG: capsid protein [Culex mosquito virus 6]